MLTAFFFYPTSMFSWGRTFGAPPLCERDSIDAHDSLSRVDSRQSGNTTVYSDLRTRGTAPWERDDHSQVLSTHLQRGTKRTACLRITMWERSWHHSSYSSIELCEVETILLQRGIEPSRFGRYGCVLKNHFAGIRASSGYVLCL